MNIDKQTIEKIIELVGNEYRPVTTRQYQIATIYATERIMRGDDDGK